MSLAATIAGVSHAELSQDNVSRETLRGSQHVRTQQSKASLRLILVVGATYLWFLWDSTDAFWLTVWVLSCSISATFRALLCTHIQQTLDQADVDELLRNEVWLFATGMLSPFLIGLAFWVVCIPGTERTVFSITVLSCMYATGSTINTSTHANTFAPIAIANLGQGILFFAGLGNRPDIAIAILLLAFLLLLLSFGKANAAFFIESVRMRLENRAQNLRLRENQRIVENSLEVALDANRSKSRFLAAASHDLRQPLHAMMLFIGTLKASEQSARQKELIGKIEETSEILRMQFNGLLDLSRFDADGVTLHFARFDLHELLRGLVENMTPQARQKSLSLSLEGESLMVVSDPMLLERLLSNLIVNAIKYTHSGQVLVNFTLHGDLVKISIVDSGGGIAAEDQQRIFEDFAQLDNPGRRHSEGSGLGLAIVRRIAGLLHIDIAVDSEVGVGSTFELAMPLIAYDAKDNPASEFAADAVAEKTALPWTEDIGLSAPIDGSDPLIAPLSLAGEVVLIVDDDLHIRDALHEYVLLRAGKPVMGDSYEMAQDLLRRFEVSFALIDDMLNSDVSGLEVAELVAESLGDKRVLLITGSESPQRFRQIESRGFTVVKKPLRTDQLDSLILSRLAEAEPVQV